MEIPIFENDEQVGTLRVSQDGLYTRFAASLAPDVRAAAPGDTPETVLTRLWLLNKNGNAASLGLLAPGPAGRMLSRRLSRLECRRLPSAPDRALVLPNGERPMLPAKQEERQARVSPAEDGKTNPERRSSHSEFAWRLLPDGSLIDPKRRLLALPWAGKRLPELARKIKVKGEEYLVFRY